MCAFSYTSRVGDYVTGKTLGTGSTGKVKLARHVRTHRLVALKIIPHSLATSNPSLFQKTRREIALLKLIAAATHRHHSHPDPASPPSTSAAPPLLGLLQLLDVFTTPSATVLVLEYCERGELFDLLITNGYLDEHTVLDYFQQLVHALHFIHRRAICHRDLKPENILLTEDGRLKIADFGLATLQRPDCLLLTSCGSPHYCAPEVLQGDSYNGPAADVWSLGVILFTMTTGGLPFDDDNLSRLFATIRTGSFYIPELVSPQLAHLIRSMLVPDVDRRATLHEVMQSPWFNSSPCRDDIVVELDAHAEHDQHEDPSLHHLAVAIELDPLIVQHMTDLGLGNSAMIRRRFTNTDPSVHGERRLYALLSEFRRNGRGSGADDHCPAPEMDNKPDDIIAAVVSAVAGSAEGAFSNVLASYHAALPSVDGGVYAAETEAATMPHGVPSR